MPGRVRSFDSRGQGKGGRVRVVVADDHPSMRRSLRQVLEGEDDFEIVAEADDYATAMRHVAAHNPSVLVLDVHMPDASGVEPIRQLRDRAPRTEIVVITMHESLTFADLALRAGALGFVLKDNAELDLPEAVRHAAAGAEYRSPRLGRGQGFEPA